MVAVANTPTLTAILNVKNTWAATPVRGVVTYFCDCGTGASLACVAGSDSNAGNSPNLPKRTIAGVQTVLRTSGQNTAALCQGGAFNAPAGGLNITNSTCTAGTTCNDLREYSPTTFVGTTKPIINNPAGPGNLFTFMGNVGGVRILNLDLRGDNGPPGGNNLGVFTYAGAHDVTLGNLDFRYFDAAIYNSENAAPTTPTTNIYFTGNTVTDSKSQGYLGAGLNATIDYNYFSGNGGSVSEDHTIYLGAHSEATHMEVIGNYLTGQHGPTCNGVVMVAHGMFDYLTVADNTIDMSATETSGGCFGIGFSGVASYPEPAYFRHTIFSGNIVKNGGNVAFSVANCPNCIIENNLIIQDWAYGPRPGVSAWPLTAFSLPITPARVLPHDDVSTNNTVVNNTIWFGPAVLGGGLGISSGVEGTGHVFANNTVTYTNTTSPQVYGVQCFDYGLPLTSYSFINNNHCYSVASYSSWEKTQGSYAAWETYSASKGWDTASIGSQPNFVNPTSTIPNDFHPYTGSPLLNAGSPTYAPVNDLTGTAFLTPPATAPAIGAYH